MPAKNPINRTRVQAKTPGYAPQKKGFGPCMAALSPIQRKYIVNLYEHPELPKYQALINAGYKYGDRAASKMCSRFNHNPMVIDAIREYGAEHFTGDMPLVIARYHDVVANPKHRDHGKMLKDYMDRVGPSTVKETKATVHHTFDRDALVAKIATILERQPDALRAIGQTAEQPMQIVDAEYEAVGDE